MSSITRLNAADVCDVTALALLLERLTPGLFTPQPGEMPSETAARWDAGRDIVDDLLAEIAAEIETGAHDVALEVAA